MGAANVPRTRALTRDEATKLAAGMTGGVARGAGEKPLPLTLPAPDAAGVDTATDEHPFSHPSYWAAFILIGDPD